MRGEPPLRGPGRAVVRGCAGGAGVAGHDRGGRRACRVRLSRAGGPVTGYIRVVAEATTRARSGWAGSP
ncbi:hypothetical protein GCM10010357_23400 [Streptomyces luteireticuli]|uniref:Tryptophan synthase subunit(Beta) n=1 Tax=Streptomyces luteireticuli TaxID=173858 RepID=A0ABN0YN22_9ACTN